MRGQIIQYVSHGQQRTIVSCRWVDLVFVLLRAGTSIFGKTNSKCSVTRSTILEPLKWKSTVNFNPAPQPRGEITTSNLFLFEILAYDGVMDGKAVIRECIGVLSPPSVRDIPLSFTTRCFDFSMIYGTTSTHRSKILLVEGRNIYEDEEAEG